MSKSLFFLVSILPVALGGCTGPVIAGGAAAMMYATKPGDPPPANTEAQMAEHEVWCYSSMGEPSCYAHAQDIVPNRLINVNPENKRPLDLPSYRRAVQEPVGQKAQQQPIQISASMPASMESAAAEPVEKAPLSQP